MPQQEDIQEMPTWFYRLLIAIVCFAIAISFTGIILAMLGWYSAPLILGIGVLAAIVITLVVLKGQTSNKSSRSTHFCAFLALLIAAGSFAFNASHAGSHLFVDRDQGVYVVSARLLDRTHELLVDNPLKGPFASAPEGAKLYPGKVGFYPNKRSDGHVYSQFVHMFAVVLALAFAVGGAKLVFVVPAALSAISLLFFYALFTRVVRPAIALFCITTFCFMIPFVYVSRDTLSESLMLVLLSSGFWLWAIANEHKSFRLAVLGSTALGLSLAARLDGFILIPAVALYVSLVMIARDIWSDDSQPQQNYIRVLVVALLAGSVISILDGFFYSRQYLFDLSSRVMGLTAVAIPIAICGWFVARRNIDQRKRLLSIAAIAIPVALVVEIVLLLIRVAVVGRPTSTNPFDWLHFGILWPIWYVGIVGCVVGLIGVMALLRQTILRGQSAALFTVVAATISVLYLYSPEITPDQPWGTRRMVSLLFPLLILGIGVALSALWNRRSLANRIGAGVLGAVVLGNVLFILKPVQSFEYQQPAMRMISDTCEFVDGNPVALLNGQSFISHLPYTLRAFCGVPVAVVSAPPEQLGHALEELHNRWEAESKNMVVISGDAAALDDTKPSFVTSGRFLAPNYVYDNHPNRLEPDHRASRNKNGMVYIYGFRLN